MFSGAGSAAAADETGIWALVLKASLFAKAILGLLAVLLYLTLWHIFRKRRVLRLVTRDCAAFETAFWSGRNAKGLLMDARDEEFGEIGLAPIFISGWEEVEKLRAAGVVAPDLVVESARRAMNARAQQESDYLNRHMQFLATVAGVSPYIGLLGTVWGIITSFRSLANATQATIAHVAPGIAEALIATAMGLLAAIPAVVAYNYFHGRIEAIIARFENFIDYYSNILHRNL